MTGRSSSVEQLHYTWAKHGLQGLGRFQVTAASPGLRDLDGPLARLAVKLCRYQAPSSRYDPPPLSFGWIDARGYRFVFHRCPVGSDVLGRPGNFAAHVLVVPVSALSVTASLALAGTWSWWTGAETDSPDLPALDTRSLALSAAHAVRPSATVDTVAELFAVEWHGRVGLCGEELISAARAASAQLPEVTDGWSSFSTYESGDSVDWFDLVGVATGASRVATSAHKQAASLVLADSESAQRQRRGLVTASRHGGRIAWSDFSLLSAALGDITDDVPALEPMLVALAQPSIAEEVLLYPPGRTATAAALASKDPRAFAALASGAAGIAAELLQALGRLVAESTPESELAYVAAALVPLPAELLEGFVRGLPESAQRSLLEDWPVQVLTAAVTCRAWADAEHQQALTLLLPQAGVLLWEQRLARADRSFLAVNALREKYVSAQQIATFLVANEDVASLLIPGLTPDELRAVFSLGRPEDSGWLLAQSAKVVSQEGLIAALGSLLPRLSPEDAVALVGRCSLRRVRAPIADALADVVDRVVVECVAEDLADPYGRYQPQRIESLVRDVPALSYWRALVVQLSSRKNRVGQLDVTRSLIVDIPSQRRATAARYALHHHAADIRTVEDVEAVLRWLAWEADAEPVQYELLRAVERHRRQRMRHPIAVAAVQYLLPLHWTDRIQQKITKVAVELQHDEWQEVRDRGVLERSRSRQHIKVLEAARAGGSAGFFGRRFRTGPLTGRLHQE